MEEEMKKKDKCRSEDATISMSMDRRSFLGLGASAALVVTATGLTACAPNNSGTDTSGGTGGGGDQSSATSAGPISPQAEGELTWLPPEPQIADADIEAEVSADVLVVGCGLAGVCAIRSAVEEGASVISFEKAGGVVSRSGEFAVINGNLQKRWGRDNILNIDKVIDHEMTECSYKIKRAILSKWAYNHAPVFDWYIGAKEDLYIADTTRADIPDENADAFLIPLYIPMPEKYDWENEQFPTYPTSCELMPSQQPVLQANFDMALDAGLEAYFGHFVEKLIKDTSGRITGLYARNAATGKYVKATANKGVVLATGEYGSNKDILGYYCPDVVTKGIPVLWMNMDVEGNPTNTGDGLKLGAYVNAAIQDHHAPMIHAMGAGADSTGESVMGINGFLLLNKDGKRFTNEDIPGQQYENQIELQRDYTAYQIWDSKWKEQLEYFPAGHGVKFFYDERLAKNNNEYKNYGSQAKLDKAVEEGRCIKAESIEELLQKIDASEGGGINTEQAKKSLERYNELCHNGKDEDFGKPASRLFPVENAPFYAATTGLAAMLVCIGGLVSDEDCRVYDNNGMVIPGLYVAGNIQGDRFAVQYPIALKGVSHSIAMYYGYVAGKNVFAGI
jgi:succinate dehydrogenase/fumarate reductase flavoprotein subunit